MKPGKFSSGHVWHCTDSCRSAARMGSRRFELLLRFAMALSILVIGVPEAAPTTFARLSLEQLSSAAPLIVRARCQGSIVSAVKGEIWTVTSFEVREIWKGSAPAVVRVRLLGGRTAELTSHVEGVPRFRAGEDVVLFLGSLRGGEYSVAGWAQGTFRIRRGGAEASEVVTQDTALFSPAAFVGGSAARDAQSGAVRGMPLEKFRRRVAESLARHR